VFASSTKVKCRFPKNSRRNVSQHPDNRIPPTVSDRTFTPSKENLKLFGQKRKRGKKKRKKKKKKEKRKRKKKQRR
jgi:hypothetical protein